MRRRDFCGALAGLSAFASAHAANSGATVDAAFFGMHFHALAPTPEARRPTPWPADAPFGALRLWDADTRWADLAPAPGQWDFERLDTLVALATAHGAQVLLTLGSPPRWAAARPDEPGPYGPGSGSAPARLDDWRDYVGRVTARYRGRIHAYELWNEPNLADVPRDRGAPGFYTGDVATLVALARVARAALRAHDPAARLFTPGFVNGPDRLALFLEAGGGAQVDGVAYHFYADGTARFQSQLAEVRGVMRRAGVERLPLWNTECGVASAPDGDAEAQRSAGAQLARLVMLAAAGGVARFHDYAWDDAHSGMTDPRGAPTPRQLAWRRTRAWLLGARLAAPEPGDGGRVVIHGSRPDGDFTLAWADRAQPWSPPPGRRALRVESLFGEARATPPSSLDAVPLRMQWSSSSSPVAA